MFPILSKALQEVDMIHEKKSLQLRDFLTFIDKEIVKGILQKEQADYAKKIDFFRQEVQDAKRKSKE